MDINTIRWKVVNIERPIDGVATLFLEAKDGIIHSYKPGQFLTFIFNNLATKEIRRSYSLSSTYGLDDQLAVTVKQQPNGAVSSYLCQEVKVGDELTSIAPAGNFVLPARRTTLSHYLMLAAGSGITPLFSLIKAILHFNETSNVHLIYANTDEQKIIFREEIGSLLQKFHQRFSCLHLLSNKKGAIDLTNNGQLPVKVIQGRLSNILLEDYLEANWTYPAAQTEIYLCGPSGFMLKASNTLRFMGFPERQLHQEIFDIVSPFRPAADTLTDSSIVINRNGSQHAFDLRAGESILEAALRNDIQLPYSCNSGTCTTCSVQCLEGSVKMFTIGGPTDSDDMQGTVFTCVGYPQTRKVVLEIG